MFFDVRQPRAKQSYDGKNIFTTEHGLRHTFQDYDALLRHRNAILKITTQVSGLRHKFQDYDTIFKITTQFSRLRRTFTTSQRNSAARCSFLRQRTPFRGF